MEFEYDRNKSKANKAKHGIDFEQAKALWSDELRVVVPLKYISEPREFLIAELNGKLWTAVVTQRGQKMRIISVRRSRQQERDIYYGH